MTNAFNNAASSYSNAADAIQKRLGFLDGFKEFISRGNAVDLAVGVVIGAAFGAVVAAITDGILYPLIGAIFGKPNFDNVWTLTLNGTDIHPFVVVTALLNFLIVAAAIYFLVVLPLNRLAALRKVGAEPEPAAPAEDVLLLTEIRDLLAARPTPPAAPGTPAGQ